MAERYEFARAPYFLVGYRQVPGSMSRQYEKMLRSHSLIMKGVRQRHPELPSKLFRWATARAEFHLGMRALSAGDLREGSTLCARALLKDPALALSRATQYALYRKLISSTTGATGLPFEHDLRRRRPSNPSWITRRRWKFVSSLNHRS
jgi:hypothetical protein